MKIKIWRWHKILFEMPTLNAGQRTWREDLRGRARDHTLGNPLLPPAQHIDPPTNLTAHEAIMLQYLPIRDDFEVCDHDG